MLGNEDVSFIPTNFNVFYAVLKNIAFVNLTHLHNFKIMNYHQMYNENSTPNPSSTLQNQSP